MGFREPHYEVFDSRTEVTVSYCVANIVVNGCTEHVPHKTDNDSLAAVVLTNFTEPTRNAGVAVLAIITRPPHGTSSYERFAFVTMVHDVVHVVIVVY